MRRQSGCGEVTSRCYCGHFHGIPRPSSKRIASVCVHDRIRPYYRCVQAGAGLDCSQIIYAREARMLRALVLASFTVLCLTTTPSAAAQDAPGEPHSPEAQRCAALVNLDLEATVGGPALITSAQLMDVRQGPGAPLLLSEWLR